MWLLAEGKEDWLQKTIQVIIMNTPTPETDAAAWTETNWANACVTADFARKLERERDKALALFQSGARARASLDEALDKVLADKAAISRTVKACMEAMPFGNQQTHTPENLAARIEGLAYALDKEVSENEDMREAIMQANERLSGLEDHLAGNHGLFLLDAISKLKPFIND
jgi:hypothetical protein